MRTDSPYPIRLVAVGTITREDLLTTATARISTDYRQEIAEGNPREEIALCYHEFPDGVPKNPGIERTAKFILSDGNSGWYAIGSKHDVPLPPAPVDTGTD